MSQQYQQLNPVVETAPAAVSDEIQLQTPSESLASTEDSPATKNREIPPATAAANTDEEAYAAITDEEALAAELERQEAGTDLILQPEPFKFDLVALLRRSAINLVLPFINGMMLGFGEIVAHEIGFRYNWIGARVQPPRRAVQRAQNVDSKFL